MTLRHPSRRRSVIALVLLAVVVGAMALVIARAGSGEPQPQPSASSASGSAPSAGPNPTLLVQLRDDALMAVDNVLTGTRPEGAAELFLPSDLVVDLLRGHDSTLAATGIRPVSDAAPAVAAQTGIRVDGTLVLDRLAFAGLVDSIGGITLDIKEPVVAHDGYGYVTAIVPLGVRTLDGPEAAVYVLTLNPGEPEARRQARFAQAWNAVLAKLPGEPDKVRAILGNLGALARSDQATAIQADVLAKAARASRAHTLATADLAVRPGAEGPDPESWIDPGAAQVQARTLFADEVLPPAKPPVRVRLYAGTAAVGEVQVVRDKLIRAGFSVVWSGPATPPAPAGAVSSIAAAAAQFQDVGRDLATAIGQPATPVTVDAAASPGAPLTLVYSEPVGQSGSPAASASVASSGR